MKPHTFFNYVALLLAALLGCACQHGRSIAHASPASDSLPSRFLPGIVSTDALDFCTAFSADGKQLFFCRGERGSWQIYELAMENAGQSKPRLAAFSEEKYSQADPFVTDDGTLYFISNRPLHASDSTADYNIWRTKSLDGGGWSEPKPVEQVNSDSTEYYVSIAKNGNLYFASNRPGGAGGLDLYVSERVNGSFTTPKNLGHPINTAHDEHDPLIIGKEEYLVFTSDRPGGLGEADLYYAQKLNRKWLAPQNMGSPINTPTYEYCPNFSRDFSLFFYSSESDIKYIDSKYLPFSTNDVINQ